MDFVEILAEVLKYVAPAAIVLLTVKYMNDAHLKKHKLDHESLLQGEILRQHLPLMLTAYERGILFLERVSPENLLPRVNGSGKNLEHFHQELISEIRGEFEHNLAQQLYIKPQSWAELVKAKEEVLSLINQSAKELGPENDGISLSKKIIEKCSTLRVMPSHKATFMLKMDIQKLFLVNSSKP